MPARPHPASPVVPRGTTPSRSVLDYLSTEQAERLADVMVRVLISANARKRARQQLTDPTRDEMRRRH